MSFGRTWVQDRFDMNLRAIAMIAAGAWLCALSAWGDARRATDCLDAAGGRGTSASYAMDGCLGAIGGISTNASPPETVRHGYTGQLTEVAALSVTGTPSQVNEGATSQLGGVAVMDDDTATVLSGGEIAWAAPSYPIQSISSGGLATASLVYVETNGSLGGWYLGAAGSGSLKVLDTDSDNYGSYAGDGLPDWWQNQYFGLENPDAAPGKDPDLDLQDNSFECVANMVPTNAASRFVLRAEVVAGQPEWKNLVLSPRFENRTYVPQFSTDLTPGSFQTLTTTLTSDNGTERTVTDTNATSHAKFYRINITNP